jgi:hypothetical protein
MLEVLEHIPDAVPETAIRKMLGKLTPPETYEATRVEWHSM